MTINDIIGLLGDYDIYLVVAFVLLPLATFGFGKAHPEGKGGQSPYKYIYAVIVYLACVPGMFSGVVTAYTFFFLKGNLLEANLAVYFLPIASMAITLILAGKTVDMKDVPGFDRLLGLSTLLGVTFALTLIIMKTRIWLVFGASFQSFVLIAGFLFLLLKWGAYTLFRGKREKKIAPPEFPDL